MTNKMIALVTGGARGIGEAISRLLLEAGYFVIVISKTAEINQKWMSAQSKGGFADVDAYVCDITDFQQCCKVIKRIQNKYKKIDVLVNNAGIVCDKSFKKMSEDNWYKVIDVNLNGIFNITRNVIEIMLANNYGRIINISSINAQLGCFGQTNYTAAKSGIYGFTKSLAREVAAKNITVNTVSPGYIATGMFMQLPEEKREEIVSKIPAARAGLPKEVARLIVFLADVESSYITGANFSINGGLYE